MERKLVFAVTSHAPARGSSQYDWYSTLRYHGLVPLSLSFPQRVKIRRKRWSRSFLDNGGSSWQAQEPRNDEAQETWLSLGSWVVHPPPTNETSGAKPRSHRLKTPAGA